MREGIEEALERVSRLCDMGFASHDPAHYAAIGRELEPFKGEDGVDKMLRLCAAGPTMGSKRFAYPHIQSDAKDMLAEIRATTGAPRP